MLLHWFLSVVCKRVQRLVGVTGFARRVFGNELRFLVEGLNKQLFLTN